MAIYNTPDGRQVVGSTTAGNDYHGFNGKRDIIIQLTADGATTDGLNALEYLKAYAVEQNKQNKPIFPNGTRVFISANGYTKAVEADDIVIDGDNITIGGIKWDGSAWDYSEAGQTGGALPPITSADAGKVLTATDSGVWGAQNPIGKPFIVTLTPTAQDFSGTMDKTVAEINAAYEAGQEIWFKIAVGSDWTVYPLSRVGKASADTYPSFNCNALYDENNVLVMIYTATTNDGTRQTYSTKVYTLTASGGTLVVTDTNGTLDKTWQEIYDADFAVVVQSALSGKKKYAVTEVLHNRDNTEFLVNIIGGDPTSYTASSADGYPAAE